MKITGRSILLSLVLLLPTSLYAFHPDDGGHGGITRDALDEISVTINGETVKFTDAAKEEIKAANNSTDLSFDFFTPSAHFDDEKLRESSLRIIGFKALVIFKATFGDGKEARKYLGQALHTIQDFFAHSNEPDEGLHIPNFGVDVLDKLPITTPTCTGSLFEPGSTLIPGVGLTTGYFLIPLCDVGLPQGKCIHGLGLCPGIAKDPPNHPFHQTAYALAVIASRNFINLILNDSRMTPDAIKRLMDIRPMIAAVIDNTGSMGPVIAGVRGAVASIVNTTAGTPDQPDKYLLEQFGDPDIGTPLISTDPNDFLAAVDAIVPSGGGDCPELSMSGAYRAIDAADNGSRVFLYTDASAKDEDRRASVANLAMLKNIQFTTALSGNCSPYDPAYFELARRTGGQVFITSRTESATTLANLMKPLVRNDVHLILEASLPLTGGSNAFTVPIDETVKQAIFSVGMITKGPITVRRPSGVAIQETDIGVTITDTIGSKMVTVNAPERGNWVIEVSGTDRALITVFAATPSYLLKFEFVDLAGRTGHQGLFPIGGNPIIGKIHTARAVMVGAVSAPEFSFRRPDGSVISKLSMARNNPLAPTKEDFIGEGIVPPIEPFLLYVTGTTPGGQPFQRVFPGEKVTSSVEVRVASDLTLVPAGRTTPVVFTITNHGASSTFALTAIDSLNSLTTSVLAPVTLNTDESHTVTVNVQPPANTAVGTSLAVTLTATAGTDATTNSASTILAIDQNNRDPMCSAASANPSIIRKANHKMIPISIVGVVDADNDPVRFNITAISQDEPIGSGSSHASYDAIGVGTPSAQVRAERSSHGDGRVYRIAFTATDSKGGQCSGSVKVEVPHDHRVCAPDNGSAINSLGTR